MSGPLEIVAILAAFVMGCRIGVEYHVWRARQERQKRFRELIRSVTRGAQ